MKTNLNPTAHALNFMIERNQIEFINVGHRSCNFSKVMLNSFFIYRKRKMKACWPIFVLYKPVCFSMYYQVSNTIDLLWFHQNTARCCTQIFLHDRTVDSDVIYGHNTGRLWQSSRSLSLFTICFINNHLPRFR